MAVSIHGEDKIKYVDYLLNINPRCGRFPVISSNETPAVNSNKHNSRCTAKWGKQSRSIATGFSSSILSESRKRSTLHGRNMSFLIFPRKLYCSSSHMETGEIDCSTINEIFHPCSSIPSFVFPIILATWVDRPPRHNHESVTFSGLCWWYKLQRNPSPVPWFTKHLSLVPDLLEQNSTLSSLRIYLKHSLYGCVFSFERKTYLSEGFNRFNPLTIRLRTENAAISKHSKTVVSKSLPCRRGFIVMVVR